MVFIFDDQRVANIVVGESLTGKNLAELVAAMPTLGRVQIEQSDNTRLPTGLIAALAEHVFRHRPEILLRCFGGTELDLSFLQDLPMLQNLALEATTRIESVPAVAGCKELKTLALSLPKFVDANLLEHVATTVEELKISSNRKHDLTPLSRLQRLRCLHVVSCQHQLAEVLPSLPQLQMLRLYGVSQVGTLESVAKLRALHSIRMDRCDFSNLEPLTQLSKLRSLHLERMPKLANIDFVSRLLALQVLYFETLSNVKAFPSLTALRELHVVHLASMSAMHDFAAFETAPSLQEFAFHKVARQRPTDFEPVLRNESLKSASVGFQKKIDVQGMTALLTKYGVADQVSRKWDLFPL